MYFISRDDVEFDSFHVGVGDILTIAQLATIRHELGREGYLDLVMCDDLDLAMQWQDSILQELADRLATV
jgi:hypothetical protein